MNTNKTQILHAVKFYVKRPNLRSGVDCMKLIINKDYGTNAMNNYLCIRKLETYLANAQVLFGTLDFSPRGNKSSLFQAKVWKSC